MKKPWDLRWVMYILFFLCWFFIFSFVIASLLTIFNYSRLGKSEEKKKIFQYTFLALIIIAIILILEEKFHQVPFSGFIFVGLNYWIIAKFIQNQRKDYTEWKLKYELKKKEVIEGKCEDFYFAFLHLPVSLTEIFTSFLTEFKDKYLLITTIDGEPASKWLERYGNMKFLQLNIHYECSYDTCIIYPDSFDVFLKEDFLCGGDEMYITLNRPSDARLKEIQGGRYGHFSEGIPKHILQELQSIDAIGYFSGGEPELSIAHKNQPLIENIVKKFGKLEKGVDVK